MADSVSQQEPAKPDAERGERPFFSVITPVWNRAHTIRRCIDSVLSQDFDDYEIIAVDDGSEDDSLDVLRGYTDSRVKVVALEANGGPCLARHVGTQAARGKWFLYLDSDWVYAPGALGKFHKATGMVGPRVGYIGMMATTETGQMCPSSPLPEGEFGFEEWAAWAGRSAVSDFLVCHRREIYETLQWPTDRRLEGQFVLRMAWAWRGFMVHEVVGTMFTNAPNRICSDRSPRAMRRALLAAEVQSQMFTEMIDEFGERLQEHGLLYYRHLLRQCATQCFLAGHRAAGMRYAVRLLRHAPLSPKLWGTIVPGLMGPKALLTFRRWMGR
ncbi:MAG: glycosyltransferase family 2 protein [Phycisphaerae bacterium]